MQTATECIPCLVRQAAEALEMSTSEGHKKEALLRDVVREIADADWNAMPVSIAQRIQRLVRDRTGQIDPYRMLKDQMNRIALDLLPQLIEQSNNHYYPAEAVTRLAVAGNLLDAGSQVRLAPEDLAERIKAIWDKPLVGSVEELFQAADGASRILYLADNAGEIVFDRLLIEALPSQKITVAVRGLPVINDATMEDAKTAGIDQLVEVIANGSDAPGTLIEECSNEFRDAFNRADLVIAKGQGNYETLSEADRRIMLKLDDAAVKMTRNAVLPVEKAGLKVMSIAFLLREREDAVIWRGPMKMGAIKQFLTDVAWGELDYLIIDSPPGTGDEPLSIAQLAAPLDGAIIVTTPQDVATADVRKSVAFCHKLALPVLGVVENMSGFVCPECGKATDIFKSGGGQRMADEMEIPFLGRIPIDPAVGQACDHGTPFVYHYNQSGTAKAFQCLIETVLALMDKLPEE